MCSRTSSSTREVANVDNFWYIKRLSEGVGTAESLFMEIIR